MAIYVLNELTKCFSDAELCMVGPDKDGTINKCKDTNIPCRTSGNITHTGDN